MAYHKISERDLRELFELRREVNNLRMDKEDKQKEISELKTTLHDQDKLHSEKVTLHMTIQNLELRLQKIQELHSTIAKEKHQYQELTEKYATLENRYNTLNKWYKQVRTQNVELRRNLKHTKNIHDSETIKLNQIINNLKLQLQKSQNEIENLNETRIEIINVKQKLAEKNTALEESKKDCSHLDDYVHSAMNIIKNQKPMIVHHGFPDKVTDMGLINAFYQVHEKNIHVIGQMTKLRRDHDVLQKQFTEKVSENLALKTKMYTMQRYQETFKRIPELQRTINELTQDIKSLEAEAVMYESKMLQEKSEKERLKVRLDTLQNAYYKSKSNNQNLFDLRRMEQRFGPVPPSTKRVPPPRPHTTLNPKPPVKAMPVLIKQAPIHIPTTLNKHTPLPPITSKAPTKKTFLTD